MLIFFSSVEKKKCRKRVFFFSVRERKKLASVCFICSTAIAHNFFFFTKHLCIRRPFPASRTTTTFPPQSLTRTPLRSTTGASVTTRTVSFLSERLEKRERVFFFSIVDSSIFFCTSTSSFSFSPLSSSLFPHRRTLLRFLSRSPLKTTTADR